MPLIVAASFRRASLRFFFYGNCHAAPLTTRAPAPLTQPPPKKTFDKLLIANRGEIACRIIRTAKRMGIQTVAVYSDLDERAMHVQMADEAVHLGAAAPSASYLSIPRILEAVRQTGAQAVHPGYGFLSENATFVQALEAQGTQFVGPSATAIAAMGDKIQSKKLARASGVHCIPGCDAVVPSVEAAMQVAQSIGYPVMIKASAGGGGKGMRIAWNDNELVEGFMLARQESKTAFGDDRLLLEKYIDQPRHIEIQVLGDQYGNVVSLPERECSIQRRNQKVVEESPSMHVDQETRRRMGEQAVALAKHVVYSSAGTVEFLLDASRNFYFLEMNTRLQVEHPITEFVTGLDLVEQMLYSAAGHRLSIEQAQVKTIGWAMESRVYAEDPKLKYLPSAGRLVTYQEPPATDTVRCDAGCVEGSDMLVDYDPLICKLTTYGQTRHDARTNMVRALDTFVIQGVTHNIPLLRAVVAHPRFIDGDFTTHFLQEEYPDGFQSPPLQGPDACQLAAVSSALWLKKERSRWTRPGDAPNPFQGWVQITDDHGHRHDTPITITQIDEDQFKVARPGSDPLPLRVRWPLDGRLAHATLPNEDTMIVQCLDIETFGFRVQHKGNMYSVAILNERQHALTKHLRPTSPEIESKVVYSPMPGRIVSLSIKEGQQVKKGSELAVVEAMKMQNVLRTSREGRVQKIHVKPGTAVKAGQVLIEFED